MTEQDQIKYLHKQSDRNLETIHKLLNALRDVSGLLKQAADIADKAYLKHNKDQEVIEALEFYRMHKNASSAEAAKGE